jgi:hypothetical protein
MQDIDYYPQTERWGIFELPLAGPENGNPFLEATLSAEFRQAEADKVYPAAGFYDGQGIYKIRFMPDATGEWIFTTRSNLAALDGIKGKFICTEPGKGNHGPVRVHNQYHFCYADGTPYYSFGTTCYGWIHQGAESASQVLTTLIGAPFNKVRMCVFPVFNPLYKQPKDPEWYPFEGTPPGTWDFTRFNPAFFQDLEKRIQSLMEIGVEADLILFHPYDKGFWGFDSMDAATDERYLRYIIARLGAYRNVWWSLANEYDYLLTKTGEDWEKYFQIIIQADSYRHLCSIHNAEILYDSWKPALTHASIQMGTPHEGLVKCGFEKYRILRDAYKKPVIYDEVNYEGNLVRRWGCLPGEEMLNRIWTGIVSGTYVSHGETYNDPEGWSKSGKLTGTSPARIAFLRRIMEEGPPGGLDPIDKWWLLNVAGQSGKYYLYYFGYEEIKKWEFRLPAMGYKIAGGAKFHVDVLDAWEMTITPVNGLFEITDKEAYFYTCKGHPAIDLPGKPFMALRIIRVNAA